MLRSVNDLRGVEVIATDGPAGRIHDLYIDDRYWTIRHLVVDVGHWLPGHRVLLPPRSAQAVDEARPKLRVALTRTEIEAGPAAAADKPVFQQHEIEFYRYLGFPYYWMERSAGASADAPAPVASIGVGTCEETPRSNDRRAGRSARPDPHVRSTCELTGYYVRALDGEIGHVRDFLLDDVTWGIRYLIVDTRNWWPRKRVLVSAGWIAWASWGDTTVHVDLDRATIRNAPEYAPGQSLTRAYEERLRPYYGPPKYWEPRA